MKLLLALAVFAGIIIFVLIYTITSNWSPENVVGVNVAVAAIAFLWLLYVMHKGKTDLLQALHAVEEAKKIFVL